jgi:hypothetical protein
MRRKPKKENCLVCGKKNKRANGVTCSKNCARIYTIVQRYVYHTYRCKIIRLKNKVKKLENNILLLNKLNHKKVTSKEYDETYIKI